MNMMDGISRRRFIVSAASGAALALGPASARASGWQPDGRVEFIVGVGAGGGIDITARTVQRIVQDLGLVDVPITVANMPGGGGAVALEHITNQPADGRTIGFQPANLLLSHIAGLSPHNHTDVTPLALLAKQVVAFAVHKDSDIRTGTDLIERIKADPQSVTITTGGALGNFNHLGVAMMARSAGVDPTALRVVVFSSGAEGVTATLGGHVDVGTTSVEQFLPHVESGDLRLIAVAADRRMGGPLADVPTWREQGVEAVAGNWYVCFGPPGMDAGQIAYWDEVLAAMTASEDWKRDVANRHAVGAYLDSAATAGFLDAQYDELAAIMRELGLAS